ncbi:4'-phosphopantetheinyl transferase family protein [Natronoglycomyces albus]|uniref:4'-phosphopantetheinyl transferase superfamily protein n=1 Tax=Natronoglycomyces albus TaxID=2811108 RepID=A0A895XNC8_9ACTN|nr:4'-phosphopantetheinyl transferase superfamily protein [Natronoglycomyces albus]QSB03986.1 4'-phosphopantetheinyl transferase superfamily protein [Natronoglycomyces albus]
MDVRTDVDRDGSTVVDASGYSATCTVWWGQPDQAQRHHFDLLNPEERGRARAYRQPVDQNRFIVGCVMTRLALARLLGKHPVDVALSRHCDDCERPHGRPRVPGDTWHISVSHAGDLVGVALTQAGPIGLDVEPTSQRVPEVDELVLTEGERRTLRSLPESQYDSGFLRYWVRKEAVLKAAGVGLRVAMTDISVTGPDQSAALLRYQDAPGPMLMRDVSARTGHLATVAVVTDRSALAVVERDGSELLASPAHR